MRTHPGGAPGSPRDRMRTRPPARPPLQTRHRRGSTWVEPRARAAGHAPRQPPTPTRPAPVSVPAGPAGSARSAACEPGAAWRRRGPPAAEPERARPGRCARGGGGGAGRPGLLSRASLSLGNKVFDFCWESCNRRRSADPAEQTPQTRAETGAPASPRCAALGPNHHLPRIPGRPGRDGGCGPRSRPGRPRALCSALFFCLRRRTKLCFLSQEAFET